MKKLSFLLICLMIITMTGCSSAPDSPPKDVPSDNPPAVQQPENIAQNQQPSQPEVVTADIKNNDEIYKFINETYQDKYTREDFDKWTPNYLDITGDGNNEVVFTTTYFDGKLHNLIAISVDSGRYSIIPSDIQLAKYENNVYYVDGFLLLEGKSGGSGMGETYVFFYIYDGVMIKDLKLNLNIDSYYSAPGTHDIEQKGTIEGKYTDFVYTLTERDRIKETTKLLEKSRYTYDKTNMRFNIETLEEPTPDNQSSNTPPPTPKPSKPTKPSQPAKPAQNQNTEANDYTKGYTTEIVDGCLYIKYNNTGNSIEVYQPINTTIYDNSDDGTYSYLTVEIGGALARKVFKNKIKNRVYFAINAYTIDMEGDNQTVYYDFDDSKVHNVGAGLLEGFLEHDPYKYWTIMNHTNGLYYIYDQNGEFKCSLEYLDRELPLQIAMELKVTGGLSGFTAETINETYIDYTQYKTVIIPEYDTVNKANLTNISVSFGDETTHSHYFAVMGSMEAVTISYKEYMDSPEQTKTFDTLNNSYVEIKVPAGSDFSAVGVTGLVPTDGNTLKEVSFSFDDVSDETADILLLKAK